MVSGLEKAVRIGNKTGKAHILMMSYFARY